MVFFSIFILAPSACTCPKERQIDCFRLDPANTSCLNLLQFVHRLMLISPLHTPVGNKLIEVLLLLLIHEKYLQGETARMAHALLLGGLD